jgi:hypothetical protein
VLLYSGFMKFFFLSSFFSLSDFRYHYLSVNLYLFAISIVIVKNDVKNKIIHMLRLLNTLCIKIFLYYYLII